MKLIYLQRIAGLCLIALGIAFILWGYEAQNSVSNQLFQWFTQRSIDDVYTRYIAGTITASVGFFFLIRVPK